MADNPEGQGGPAAARRGYLPILTWALLGLLCVWIALWYFAEDRLQVAAFREALDYVPSNFIEEVDRTELFHAAMAGMMAGLGDKYSGYVTPEQNRRIQEQTRGEFVGIGVTISQVDGLPLILQVHRGSPALTAALERGDLITHVDGEDIEGMSLEDVVSRIRGDVGAQVTLGLRRPDPPQTLKVTVTREKISLPNVEWEMQDNGIGLLRMNSFDQDCASEVEQGLKELARDGLRGLILDLRSNAGGLVDQAIGVCDLFLDEGLIFSVRGRPGTPVQSVNASGKTVLEAPVPIAVLVDEGTASAAELVSGALQAHGRATVIGAVTVGKGSVTSVHPLPDGSGLVLTVAHYGLAGDRLVEGEGITPDMVVGEIPPFPRDEDPEKVRAWKADLVGARREQLEAAVQFLTQELAAR